MKNTSKKDPFDFDDPAVVKKDYTKEEIKKFEKEKLQKYLCVIGDDDWTAYMEYLHELLDEGMKAAITKRTPKLCASMQTQNEIKVLIKRMPQMGKIKPLKLAKGSSVEDIKKVKETQQKAVQKVRDDYKKAIKKFRDDCEPDLGRIATNAVVGQLGTRGRDRYLKDKGMIGFYKDGQMFINKDSVVEYQKTSHLLEAYYDLVGRRNYMRQQELAGMTEDVVKGMGV